MTTIALTGGSANEPGNHARVHILACNEDTAVFDVTTQYNGRGNVTCTNITREDRDAIVEALQAVFPVAEPEPEPVPDIALPVPTMPQATTVELDGQSLVLVNWLDFRGWEVRRRATTLTSKSRSGVTLGWVAAEPIRGTTRYGVEKTFIRIDEALRWVMYA